MKISSAHTPLSNVQTELLKVFVADIPEKHLNGLKNVMARFLLDSARDKADTVWDENGYTDEKLRHLLHK